MNEPILIVEDDPKVAKLAQDYLENNQFRVLKAADGNTAMAVFRNEHPDLVVLDLNLPGMDGLDVCRAMRRESDVPIIMLTARSEEADRLIGLEIGADDYITKPFSPRELVARVRVLLRRVQGGLRQPGLLQVGDLELDLEGHQLKRDGEPIELSRTEFRLQAFSRAQLLGHLHGVAYEGYDRSIDAHIKNLRRKLEVDPAEPRYVLTVYGIGYKFNDALES
jgi:two-component system alkaline phosphatase synthesis response regulator PhoP